VLEFGGGREGGVGLATDRLDGEHYIAYLLFLREKVRKMTGNPHPQRSLGGVLDFSLSLSPSLGSRAIPISMFLSLGLQSLQASDLSTSVESENEKSVKHPNCP